MERSDRKPATLNYDAPEPSAPLPPPFVAILLCLPMLFFGFLMIPAPVRPLTPLPLYRWLWVIRAFAMLCALISIFLFCDRRVKYWPWFVRLTLLITIPGLAACTFAILRYVVINMPSPN